MPIHDSRQYMKKICMFSSGIKLCAIPLNLVLAGTLAQAVTSATQGDIHTIIQQSIWAFVLALSLMAIQLGGQVVLQKKISQALHRRKLSFLDEILSKPLYQLFDTDHGELLEHLNDDIDTSSSRYIKLWPTMLAGVLTAAVYTLYLLPQSPLVLITLFGISLLQLAPPIIVKRYMQINYNDCREIESKITSQIIEAVVGFETIKLYGLKEWWQRRMASLHKNYILIGNKSEATATAQISMNKLLDNILKYGTYAVLGLYAMFEICPMETAILGISLSSSLYEAVKLFFSAIPDIAVAHTADTRLAKWQSRQNPGEAIPKDECVSLRNVSYSYDGHSVLSHVSQQFETNKIYLIDGANGAGKSTLMNLIVGLLCPDLGDVRVGDVAPADFASSVYPCDILFIPQADPEFDISACELFEMFDKHLLPTLTQTAIRLGLLPARMSACAIRELSNGERKKVFLAMAFSLNPHILLLDEPTNFLDEQSQTTFNMLMSERTGTTFIISHDPQCRAVAHERFTIVNGGIQHAVF